MCNLFLQFFCPCVHFYSITPESYNACKKLTDKGAILVSAFDNSEALSYPAAFDCVMDIERQKSITIDNIYRLINSPIDFLCRNQCPKVQWLNNTNKFMYGNSFLAPWFAVASVKLKQNGRNCHYKDVIRCIEAISSSTFTFDELKQSIIPYYISQSMYSF